MFIVIDISNKLNVASDTISNRELTLFISGGLGAKYNPIAAAIIARSEPFAIDDIQGLVLTHEARITKNNLVTLESPL